MVADSLARVMQSLAHLIRAEFSVTKTEFIEVARDTPVRRLSSSRLGSSGKLWKLHQRRIAR